MTTKVKAAIIGSGNIGTDLLYKALRSDIIEPVWMVGIDPESEGLKRAKELGLKTTDEGVKGHGASHRRRTKCRSPGMRPAPTCTSRTTSSSRSTASRWSTSHPPRSAPSACRPSTFGRWLAAGEQNVNMVTCGGQATIPMVAAVSRVQPVEYGEIIATVSSKSAGPGTRKNIDEFTRTTAKGVEVVGARSVARRSSSSTPRSRRS